MFRSLKWEVVGILVVTAVVLLELNTHHSGTPGACVLQLLLFLHF